MSTTQPEALRENYTAADMATASAQGFRDGVASVAASAGSEPVAWMYNRLNSELNPWLMKAGKVADDLRVGRCDPHFGVMLKPCDNHVDWTPLYTHPSPPEGMVGGWRPIETAPKDGRTVIVGRDMGDFGFVRGYGRFEGAPGAFRGGWISHGFSERTGNLGLAHPTHWMPLPPPPTTSAGSGKGGEHV